jgi:hypothetical protein
LITKLIHRFFRFKYFSADATIAKRFYICLFITGVMRASGFIMACLMYRSGIAEEQEIAALRAAITASTSSEEIELFPKKLFLFMIIPEFMVITAFLLLFW